MIFVDANIPMYLVGADHPNKVAAERKLDALIMSQERLVTDVEVEQEILHRYAAIDRRDAIQPAFDALLGIVDEVFALEPRDVARAKGLVLERRELSARDAIHVAIMERHSVSQILTFDRGFDAVPGIRRI
ncbi:MAG: PIN domain-containing protein [Gemmatimonadetes bacterium]|nr:PIN domain-containing protein [Gemmatimonadota bacterium]